MSRSRHPAATPEQASALDDATLDRMIASCRFRIGIATKATLRNEHRKMLAMLEGIRSERKASGQ